MPGRPCRGSLYPQVLTNERKVHQDFVRRLFSVCDFVEVRFQMLELPNDLSNVIFR